MELLLAFLLGTFVIGCRSANRPNRPRAWVLLGLTMTVALGYLGFRFV